MLASIAILSPFVGAILLWFFGANRVKFGLGERFFAVLGMAGPIVSFICAALLAWEWHLKGGFGGGVSENFTIFTWISVASFEIEIGIFLDKLSVLMTAFVAFLAMLIHFYSIGYMSGESGFGRFFAYMNLFLGSMLVLVLANNPMFMFLGWEGVGACSYLLISFYFEDNDNVKAGNKAFIVNRVGDFGFVIGLVSLYIATLGTGFNYESLAGVKISPNLAFFIGLCFMCGALAKSAQIPLYTWLPDAMAGPTPISALIHAATMVTAGVYMVLRFDFLFANLGAVLEILAFIGVLSAVFAAIIATKATDIKKILAYSTMSQLGYMFAALPFAKGAALFHLFTHGFFKALLFLGAGAVIIALHHEQNIFKMGSLKGEKILFWPMLFGTLAIAGIFPFAGFFSKDAIILQAFLNGYYITAALLLAVAGLTAYYMFRLFFLVFYSKNHSAHPHKIPKTMAAVNVILSFFAIFGGGLIFILDLPHISLGAEIIGGAVSVGVACVGIFVAYKKFYNYENHAENLGAFERVVANKFYIDEIYDAVFVQNLKRLSLFITQKFDAKILYGVVFGVANSFKNFSKFYATITQNGRANFYAFFMAVWICAIIIYIKVGL